MNVVTGIFVLLHGLVHMWYVTLSRGWVQFQPEMGWSGRSWLISGVAGTGLTRAAATALYSAATVALVLSGVGLLSGAGWTRPLLVTSAGISTAAILIFWDGGTEMLVQKGLLGLIINLGILAAVLLVD